jgi:hypothetical protein
VAPIIGVLIFASVATAMAQRRGGFGGGGGRFAQIPIAPNVMMDDSRSCASAGPDYGYVSQRLPWSHDYPAGEQHFMNVNELSLERTAETNILRTFDDRGPRDRSRICASPAGGPCRIRRRAACGRTC